MPWPPDGANTLSHYITRVGNSFQNLGPLICETPELTVPGIVGIQVSAEIGLQDTGRADYCF